MSQTTAPKGRAEVEEWSAGSSTAVIPVLNHFLAEASFLQTCSALKEQKSSLAPLRLVR